MRSNRGRLIAIEGIDQSGKRTQTRLLANKLRARGISCSILNFPDYTTPIGRQIRRYLAGGNNLDLHAAHLLYAANKWERAAEIERDINLGRILIVNRYTPSNIAYGVAHGLPLKWLISLENGLPRADAVIILDVSPKTSFSRKEQRRDVHEGNRTYLNKVRSVYRSLARQHHWKVLDGQRDPHIVQSEVWKLIAPLLGSRKHES